MYHSVSRCHQLGSLRWGREVYRNSSLSAQFCCEPKTSLKNEIYFLKEFTVLNILNNIKLSILQPKKQWIKQLRKRFNLLQPEEEKGKKKPPCCRACLVTSQSPWQRGRGFPFGLEPSERTQQRVLADTGALSEGPLLTPLKHHGEKPDRSVQHTHANAPHFGFYIWTSHLIFCNVSR